VPGKERVAVSGLKEFRKGLKELDSSLPKGLRVAMNESSTFLIDKTRPDIPRRSGRAADSLKARSSQSAVRIAVGGRRAPYYPWLDFGGATGRNKSAKRPFLTDGRYLYPKLREHRETFQQILQNALIGVARDAGLEVD
jgi:hypothetical protein